MEEVDSQFLLLINGLHTGYLDQLMWLISGKLVWIPFYIITLFAIYQKRGWQGALHLLLLVGVMMLFTDMVNSQIIRPWFHRLRPANLENPLSQYVHIVNDYRGGSYGFPSAHAANYWGLSLLAAYFMKSKRVLYSLFTLIPWCTLSRRPSRRYPLLNNRCRHNNLGLSEVSAKEISSRSKGMFFKD